MKTIEDGWQSFRAAVVPEVSNEKHLFEMRAMFYSGAMWLYEQQRCAIVTGNFHELTMRFEKELDEYHKQIREMKT